MERTRTGRSSLFSITITSTLIIIKLFFFVFSFPSCFLCFKLFHDFIGNNATSSVAAAVFFHVINVIGAFVRLMMIAMVMLLMIVCWNKIKAKKNWQKKEQFLKVRQHAKTRRWQVAYVQLLLLIFIYITHCNKLFFFA